MVFCSYNKLYVPETSFIPKYGSGRKWIKTMQIWQWLRKKKEDEDDYSYNKMNASRRKSSIIKVNQMIEEKLPISSCSPVFYLVGCQDVDSLTSFLVTFKNTIFSASNYQLDQHL